MNGQDTRPPQQPPRNGGGGGGKKKRTVTLTFSPAQLVSSVAGLGIIIVWVFILGVILGKGYAPEAHIPELERFMPKGDTAEAPRVVTPETPPLGNGTEHAEAADSEVIQPGDMAFRQSLKNASGQHSPPQRAPAAQQTRQSPQAAQPAAQQTRQNAPASAQSQAQQTRQSAQGAQAGAAPAQTAAASQSRQAPPGNAPAQPKVQAFNYVYQVAAYKDQASCDALTAKLKKAGFSASTEKSENNGSVWYKTLINFKGTPDDVDTLRAGLGAHKIERLILRSKTPVQ